MVHNTIDSIEVCILHTLMHNLYIYIKKNIASVFEINLSQDKHCKVFPTIVGIKCAINNEYQDAEFSFKTLIF